MVDSEHRLVEAKGYGLDQTYEQYAEGLNLWLGARQDRNAYLIPRNCSDPRLRRIDQLTAQLVQTLPKSARVVDLGFGPEGRDMADVLELGTSKTVSVYGMELVRENIISALENPRFKSQGANVMEGRVIQGDITEGIPLGDNSVDAVILSSVIQHIKPTIFYSKVTPEISRILKPDGVLQLIFKRKEGNSDTLTIEDVTLGGAERSFYLYRPDEIIQRFQELGVELYKGDDKMIGGVLL